MGQYRSHSEETKRKISEKQKGHKPTFVGRRLDADRFIRCYKAWDMGTLKLRDFAEIVELKPATLKKRIEKLRTEGVLEGGMWLDGKPIYGDFSNPHRYYPMITREAQDA